MPEFKPFQTEIDLDRSTLCSLVWLHEDIEAYEELIEKNYGWAPSIDRLPAALKLLETSDDLSYDMKVPLGYKDEAGDGKFYIYNHMDMVVKLAPAPNKEQSYQVVGFEIAPKSINHELHKKSERDSHNLDLRSKDKIGEFLSHDESEHETPQVLMPMTEFSFSYSVRFMLVDDLLYEDRMQKYWLSQTEKKPTKSFGL